MAWNHERSESAVINNERSFHTSNTVSIPWVHQVHPEYTKYTLSTPSTPSTRHLSCLQTLILGDNNVRIYVLNTLFIVSGFINDQETVSLDKSS